MPKLTYEEIQQRVTYHKPTERAIVLHGAVREDVGKLMERVSNQLPDCRETSVAITKLEEALFWLNAAIARNHDKI